VYKKKIMDIFIVGIILLKKLISYRETFITDIMKLENLQLQKGISK